MRFLLTCLSCLILITATAQENLHAIADSIKAEGLKLYHSELASWKATDIFFANFKDDLDQVGGYISYPEDAYQKCVFFSRAEELKVLMTVIFDSTFDPVKTDVSMMKRALNPFEADLFALRQAAKKEVTDTAFFHTYANTNLNFIPLIQGKTRRVYILTATKASETAIFGNDYMLDFDGHNRLVDKKRLHNDIFP